MWSLAVSGFVAAVVGTVVQLYVAGEYVQHSKDADSWFICYSKSPFNEETPQVSVTAWTFAHKTVFILFSATNLLYCIAGFTEKSSHK